METNLGDNRIEKLIEAADGIDAARQRIKRVAGMLLSLIDFESRGGISISLKAVMPSSAEAPGKIRHPVFVFSRMLRYSTVMLRFEDEHGKRTLDADHDLVKADLPMGLVAPIHNCLSELMGKLMDQRPDVVMAREMLESRYLQLRRQ